MNNPLQILIAVLAFLWIVMGSTHIARFFQKHKLPLITGFLFAGMVSGPFILKLVSKDLVQSVGFLSDISLAYIAFAAGAELYLKEIRNNMKSILWNTFGQLVVTFTFGAVSVFLLSDYLPFLRDFTTPVRWAIAIMSATFFVARSPSSIIAVIKELRAKGPFTKMAIGVTVIKDVLVIILFAIALSVANTLVHGQDFSLFFIVDLAIELGLTLLLGYLVSLAMAWLYGRKVHGRIKLILILALGYVIFPLSAYFHHVSHDLVGIELHVEPLLVCIIAGFRLVNYTRFRLDFVQHMEAAGPYIFAIFFTLIGAGMSLDVLASIWKIALLFFAIRLIGLILGNVAGTWLAGDPKIFRFIGWMPFITQAGVGLAFALIIEKTFPEWGEKLATIIIGVIVLNQFFGDILFKWAIRKVGESHEQGAGSMRNIQRVLIFGYESQSVALSQELLKQNWQVAMVTSMDKEKVSAPEGVRLIFVDSISRMGAEEFQNMRCYQYDTFVMMLSDEINLRINEYIYENMGRSTVIVRLQSRSFMSKFQELGALIIDPASALVNLLQHFVRAPQATNLLLGLEANKDTLDIEVRDGSLHGTTLRNLRLPSDVLVLSVHRNEQMLISHGYTRLRLGDVVTLIGSPDSLEEIRIRFGA